MTLQIAGNTIQERMVFSSTEWGLKVKMQRCGIIQAGWIIRQYLGCRIQAITNPGVGLASSV